MMKLTTTTDIELIAATPREKNKLIKHGFVSVIYVSPAVLWMAQQMEARLQQFASRNDSFKKASVEDLYGSIKSNNLSFLRGADKDIITNVTDIANYAMFIGINRLIEEGKAE